MIRDKYRIDAFIATGSMAMVYAATHRNGSRVALKILHSDLTRDKSIAERFRREGYFANSIGHPGIVRAIDDDVAEDGCAFIVMELLEGENLEQRRERLGGRLPLDDALTIADGVLDVLSAAHEHEVLHRDLKPANVFITRANEVKLLDFGVARFNDGRSSSDMTAVGMVLGTPDFMPPEQALGRRESVDARSDLWAVGATLFTVMTGKSVHTGTDAKSKLIATARSPARPIREVMPEVPPAVAVVVDRALAFDKAVRWASAKEMRRALVTARNSLDGLPSLRDSTVPSTGRPDEEAVTLARAVKRRVSPFDETVSIPPIPASEDVVTSAPPVTRRDPPPSMTASDGPTFLLRSTPAPPEDALPFTERIPPQALVAALTPLVPFAPMHAPAHAAALAQTVASPFAPTALSGQHGTPVPPGAHPPLPPTARTVPTSFMTPAAAATGPTTSHAPPPRKLSPVRVMVPILVGALAAGAVYAYVARGYRWPSRHPAPTMTATDVASAPPPMPSAAPTASIAAAPAPTTSASSPSVAAASASAPPAASSAPSKKRWRRVKPAPNDTPDDSHQ